MITDEIRHKAWDAFTTCKSEFISDKLQAVLDAVEPMLIADYQQSLNVLGEAYDKKCEEVAKARAEAPMLIEQGRQIEIRALAEKIRGDAPQSGTSWSNNRTGPPGARSQELDP